MTAIEATARTARTLEDGTLRLTIEFEPKDAIEAFNLFCTQGTKLAVVALKDGYYVEQHELQPEPENDKVVISIMETATLDDVKPAEWDGLRQERFKINGRPASNWAAFMIKNSYFQNWLLVDSEEQADFKLKDYLKIGSKAELDTNEMAYQQFKFEVLSAYGRWCESKGIAQTPQVTREHGINYLGGSLDEYDGLSLANEA